MQDPRCWRESTKKTYKTSKVAVGTVRKSIAIVPAKCMHEGTPSHRRPPGRPRRAKHVLGHSAFVDVVTELRELVRDPTSTPSRILACHAPDELDELAWDRWTPEGSR